MTLQKSYFRRISNVRRDEFIKALVIPLHERDDVDTDALKPTSMVSVLVDLFTTDDGKWDVDPTQVDYGVPQWARDRYLQSYGSLCYFDDAGGAQHIFAALLPEGWNGNMVGCDLMKGAGFIVDLVTAKEQQLIVSKQGSGWANFTMWAGNSYDFHRFGPSDKIVGVGLPGNRHVSWFGIWQEMTWAEYQAMFLGHVEPPPVEPPAYSSDAIAAAMRNLGIALAQVAVHLVTLADLLRAPNDD